MMNSSSCHFIRMDSRRLLLWVGLLLSAIATAQNPNTKITLSANASRQPAKPQDTIRYQAEISNISDTTIFNMIVNRTGDPNTSLVSGSFQSTPLAVPVAFPSILEDQVVVLQLNGLDPDGDGLDFAIVQQAQNGILGGIASVSNTAATINYQPNADFSGADQFTFSVNDDDGNHDTSAVLLSILPVNDPPGFTRGMNITVLEDVGQQLFLHWASELSAGPSDEIAQILTFNIISNNNTQLFSESPSLDNEGTLTFTANENTSGIATLLLNLQDNGGTANGGVDTSVVDALLITVLPVNDVPSFQKGNDIVLPTTSTLQTFANWATEIKAGPTDEQAQLLSFVIESIDNTALFEEAPQITADGTLTFKPAPNAVGTAIINVRLKDDNGTENGGIDVSDIQTFSITLEM